MPRVRFEHSRESMSLLILFLAVRERVYSCNTYSFNGISTFVGLMHAMSALLRTLMMRGKLRGYLDLAGERAFS